MNAAFCESYVARCRELDVLDFDDLLLETLALFEAGELPEEITQRFTYLLVDEFQDIDALQYRLVRAWTKGCKSLFAIGDPDQSIYGFRGADAACFDRLAEDIPGLRVVRLTQNYRSTPEVLGCALPVIGHNPGRRAQFAAQPRQRSAGAFGTGGQFPCGGDLYCKRDQPYGWRYGYAGRGRSHR